MKQRTIALLLAAALALSLLGTAVLAAEDEEVPAPDSSAPQAEEVRDQESKDEGKPEEEAANPTAESGEEKETPTEGEETETDGEEEPSVEEYIPDPVGFISFANVNRRMHEGNLQVLSLQESIDALDEIDYDKLKEQMRLQLNDLAQAQWGLVQASDFMSDYEYHSAYDQLDRAYDALRDQFEAIKKGEMQEDNADTKRQLQSLQNQIIKAGEATYIALAAMENQEEGLERQLDALDRKLEELQLRYELGHISSLTLKEAQAGRVSLNSGLETLRMNLNTYKGQLELLVGAEVTGEIALGALPAVSREDLDSMDLEQDMETAKANSWDLYEATETMKDALKKYNGMGGEAGMDNPTVSDDYKRARHTWYTAKYTYDNTVQNFELSLRNLYLKVQDYRQVLSAARTTLAVKQDNYAAAQLKYEQGTISQNTLLEAGDDLKAAQETVAGAENDLFSAYNTYRWAVDYGIIN